VLMAVAGVFALTVGLAAYLAVWSVAAVTSLVLAHHSELADAPALAAGPRRRPPVVRPVLITGACVLLLAPAVFVVVPAAGAARALVFPIHFVRSPAVPIAGGLANSSLGDADPSLAGLRLPRSAHPRASFGYFGFSD